MSEPRITRISRILQARKDIGQRKDTEMLREYQIEMMERLMEAWKRHRSVMVQMPTGTGKTHLMAEVIRREIRTEGLEHGRHGAEKGREAGMPRVLIVAHRRELIEQIKETLRAFGIDEQQVSVESIQKLARNDGARMGKKDFCRTREGEGAGGLKEGGNQGETGMKAEGPELVIVDEAHHAVAKTYRRLWEWWPKAKFLGLTATPCRLSGEAFTDLFDVLLQSWSIQEFIDRRWLSDFEYVSAAPDNRMMQQVRGLKKRGVSGDYQDREMCAVLDVPESIEHLYKTYKAFADGKKGIVYAINRQHAGHIDAYYRTCGVRSCVIDSKTPAGERQRLVEQYRRGELDVLVNVDVFGEGFDVPEVEFIQLARPTLSLSKYLQQVGRGMRISEGKEAVLIIDQVGMYQTFGLPTDERDWQQAFYGQWAGKGSQENVRGIVVRDEPNDKMLVNLEMVRIKRRGETHQGLEIFLKEGKYGILKDGNVACGAEMEKVLRLKAPYFAIGIYPYYIWKNRVDIIDMEGRVIKTGLYGNVRQEGDVFIGGDITGRENYWDSKGGRYYQQMPKFGRISDFEVALVGGMVYMRQLSKQWEKPFQAQSVYMHRDYVVYGDKLVFKADSRTSYQICGYAKNMIYIKVTDNYRERRKYARIDPDGDRLQLEAIPQKLSKSPENPDGMHLRRYSLTP